MKRLSKITGIGLAVGCAVCAHATGTSSIIYGGVGPTNAALQVGPLNGEVGQEVQAAGTDRLVTELQIGIFPQNSAGAADFQARLYANDGVGGAPGSLLWQSSLLSFSFPGSPSLLAFSVPDIQVPDIFTWSLQISNSPSPAVTQPFSFAPTVGSAYDFTWFRGAGGLWGQAQTGSLGHLIAEVDAVPEPSATVVLLAGVGVCWLLRPRGGQAAAYSV